MVSRARVGPRSQGAGLMVGRAHVELRSRGAALRERHGGVYGAFRHTPWAIG